MGISIALDYSAAGGGWAIFDNNRYAPKPGGFGAEVVHKLTRSVRTSDFNMTTLMDGVVYIRIRLRWRSDLPLR